MICENIINELEKKFPVKYAEDWDNVGLLVGRTDKEVKKILLALDATTGVIDMAISENIDMIITHHPMIFSSVNKITNQYVLGKKIINLIRNDISYYAMHTNFDVEQMALLASAKLELCELEVLLPTCIEEDIKKGLGCVGKLKNDLSIAEIIEEIKEKFLINNVMLYGDELYKPKKIAVLPGSGKSGIEKAVDKKCDLIITGDIGHHDGIDAVEMGINVIDATHYGLEHIFMEYMYRYFNEMFGDDISIIIEDSGSPIQII